MGKNDIFKVTGILKDLPANTQFNYIEYLCSYAQQANIDRDWTDIGVSTYVLLKPKTSPEAVNSKIKNIISKHTNGNDTT